MIWDKEELRLELIALFRAISDSSGLENMRRPNKSQFHPAWQAELQRPLRARRGAGDGVALPHQPHLCGAVAPAISDQES